MSAKPIPITSALPDSGISIPAYASPLRMTACILASDFLVLSFFFAGAVLGRHFLTPSYQVAYYFEFVPFLFLMFVGFCAQGLYPAILIHPAEEMRRISIAVTVVFLLMACSAFLWRNFDLYSRSVFLVTWAAAAPLVLMSRHAVRRIFKSRDWWGVPAVVLGSGPTAERVSRTLKDGRWGIRVVGFLSDELPLAWPQDLPPFLGPLRDASLLAAARASEYAIIAMPGKSSEQTRHIIHSCCRGFRNILLVPDMPGLCSLGIVARQMGAEIGFEMPQRLFQRGPAITKRILDIALSLTAILILLPLFALLAICVRLSSRGAVIYGHDRFGLNGGTFKALKFRTMVPDADRVLSDYLAEHPERLIEWRRDRKLKKDPRITYVGRWMRRSSLDELPQLFNVLVGQMSLVGPRPIVQDEIEKYGHRYGHYGRVRPGITGLWQVSGRNNTTYEERVTLDEYYVNNWSIWLDTYILVRTLQTVATAEGAY